MSNLIIDLIVTMAYLYGDVSLRALSVSATHALLRYVLSCQILRQQKQSLHNACSPVTLQ